MSSKDYIPAHLVVGSAPPDGYIAWHEWAEAQNEGGLRQSQCGGCGLWYFPQEAINHAPSKACNLRAEGEPRAIQHRTHWALRPLAWLKNTFNRRARK